MEHPDYKYQPRRKKSKGMTSTTSSSTNTPQSQPRQSNNNNNKSNRRIQSQNTYALHEYNDIAASPNHKDDLQTIPAEMRQQAEGQLQNVIKSEMMYQNQISSYNYNSPIFQSTTNAHPISDYSTRNMRHQMSQHHQPTDLDSRCSSAQSDNSENESHPLTPPATPYTASSHHITTSTTHLISTASPHNRNASPSLSLTSGGGGIKELNLKSQIYIDTVAQPKTERYQPSSYYDPDSHRYYSHQLQPHQFLTIPPSSTLSPYNIHTTNPHHPQSHHIHHHHLQQHHEHNQQPTHALQSDNNNFNQQIDASIEADVDPKELEQYLEPPTNIEHVRKLSNSYLASTVHFKEQNNFIELQPTTDSVIHNYGTSNVGGVVERGDNIVSGGVGESGENGSGMVTSIPSDNTSNTYYSNDGMTYQYHSHNWNGSHPL